MKYSIITVTRNSYCVAELNKYIQLCDDSNLKCWIIVDNGSNEDFIGNLNHEDPWSQYIYWDTGFLYHAISDSASDYYAIKSKYNNLFSKANNIAIQRFYLENDFIFLVNPDISIYPEKLFRNVFAEVCSQMDKYQVDIGGIKLVRPDLKTIEFAGGNGNAHVGFNQSKNLYTEPMECEWITGAFMCIRCSIIPQVGLLDHKTFRHWASDQEYCRRAGLMGKRIMCFNNITMVHDQGHSTDGDEHMETLKDLPEDVKPDSFNIQFEDILIAAQENSKKQGLYLDEKFVF